MTETAAILANLTTRTLVVLDEIDAAPAPTTASRSRGPSPSTRTMQPAPGARVKTLSPRTSIELTARLAEKAACELLGRSARSGRTMVMFSVASCPDRRAGATACRWRGCAGCPDAVVKRARDILAGLEEGSRRRARRRRATAPTRRVRRTAGSVRGSRLSTWNGAGARGDRRREATPLEALTRLHELAAAGGKAERARPRIIVPAAASTIVLLALFRRGCTRPTARSSFGAPGAQDPAGRAIVERVSWEISDGKAASGRSASAASPTMARARPVHRPRICCRTAPTSTCVPPCWAGTSRTPLIVEDGDREAGARRGNLIHQTVRVVVDLVAPGMFEVRTSEKPPRPCSSCRVRRGTPGVARCGGTGRVEETAVAVLTAPVPPADTRAAHAPIPAAVPAQRIAEAPAPTATPPLMARVEPTGSLISTHGRAAHATADGRVRPRRRARPAHRGAATAAPAPHEDGRGSRADPARHRGRPRFRHPAEQEHAAASTLANDDVARDLGAPEPPRADDAVAHAGREGGPFGARSGGARCGPSSSTPDTAARTPVRAA